MADCTPERNPCGSSGLTWSDWAYSIFQRICALIPWLASIRNALGVAADGAIQITPVFFPVEELDEVIVIVPAGALTIQAVVGDEYASTSSRLSIMNGDDETMLPAGTDLLLPPITPLFTAASDGTDPTRGHGVYPSMRIKFPAGARGFVTATYRGVGSPISLES